MSAHAQTLAAAIGLFSGEPKVNLGIYSDSEGSVGTLLPNGQASTTSIPPFGSCCDLAEVTLPGSGVALTAGTQYWLVASPESVNAPDFIGIWQTASDYAAYKSAPVYGFAIFPTNWLAAEILGTEP